MKFSNDRLLAEDAALPSRRTFVQGLFLGGVAASVSFPA